jgi:hypothetical protein
MNITHRKTDTLPNRETLVKVIGHLKQLGNYEIEPLVPTCGICYELSELFDIEVDFEVSDPDIGPYPVPGYDGLDNREAYELRQHFWEGDHKYGRARRALCLEWAKALELLNYYDWAVAP